MTVQLVSGQLADVPLAEAHRLIASGWARQLGPLPPVVETAMMAGPAPREYAPPKKPRKPKKPRR